MLMTPRLLRGGLFLLARPIYRAVNEVMRTPWYYLYAYRGIKSAEAMRMRPQSGGRRRLTADRTFKSKFNNWKYAGFPRLKKNR